MPLPWPEIRDKAIAFSREWHDAESERAEAQSFWNEFFAVFGVPRRRVASFEEPVKKLAAKKGRIDAFWKGQLVVEHKSRGQDLDRAFTQALDYFPGIANRDLPRYVLVSDFAKFRLYDIEASTHSEFALKDLHKHIKKFGFIAGYAPQEIKPQDPVNIKAAEQMGRLHDQLKAAGYDGHDLEVLLVRLVFCMFADDTGIFSKQSFRDWLEARTAEDGSDLGQNLALLFQEDFINAITRWCLWLTNAKPDELRQLPAVMERIENVRRFRANSSAAPTQQSAKTPTLFFYISQPETGYIVVPEVSSERRTYIPVGFVGKDVICSNTNYLIPTDSLYVFGVMTSAMQMAWVRQICGRLKSDYRYSGSIVYNNFPWPDEPSDKHVKAIETYAQAVLDARAAFPKASLADLYDPDTMPPALSKAHDLLDRAVMVEKTSSPTPSASRSCLSCIRNTRASCPASRKRTNPRGSEKAPEISPLRIYLRRQ